MSSITFQNDSVFLPATSPAPTDRSMPAVMERKAAPTMHADDTEALRIVSLIIFAVVALGTLAMLATVLICL